MLRIPFLIALFLLSIVCALLPARLHAAPAQLDCLSAGSGPWSSPATWSGCGAGVPAAGDNVFVQAGHTITLTADAAAANLNLSLGEQTTVRNPGKLALDSYVLDLYGKLRAYVAPIGTTPGTSATAIPLDAITVAPGSTGRVRVVGGSRVLTAKGEWGANISTGSVQPYVLEVAIAPSAVVTADVMMRASHWIITSGTLYASTSLYVGENAADTGDFVIGPQGTFISLAGGISAVLSFPTNRRGGALVVDGKLVFTNPAPLLNMRSIAFNNIVEYASANLQTLVRVLNGSGVSRYHHLVLSGGGAKSLYEPTIVTGSLTRGGTATLTTTAAKTLTYAPEAQLIYAGAALQDGGSEMTAAQNGIGGLIVHNPAGVRLNGNLLVTSTLVLDGSIDTGAYSLSLGPAATCAGAGDVLGVVLHTAIPAPGVYCFGNPNVLITVPPEATLPVSMSVSLTRGAPPFAGATLRRYHVEAPGFGGAASLRLACDAADLNGNDPATLHLWRNAGDSWQIQAATARGAGEGGKLYAERNGVGLGAGGVSDWTLAGGGAPTTVTVTDLAVALQDGQAELAWETAGELACLGFVVRRGFTPAERGQPVATVSAHRPGSPAGSRYTWRDPAPPGANGFPAATYYWLDVMDAAGEAFPAGQGVVLRLPALYLPLVRR